MNDLKTYWDLEPKTRAELSESDVQRFIDAELMLKGVLKVEPPELEPEPELPEIAKSTWHKVDGFDLVFATAEEALRFSQLKPRTTDTRHVGDYWRSNKKVEYIKAPITPGEVVPVLLATEDEITRHRSALDKLGAVEKANNEKREEHAKALRLTNEALKGLWDDWHARRAESARHRKVVDTYSSYVQTAGDHTVAAKFLQKVFSIEQIREASAWTGVSIDTEFTEPAEPGPSHPDAPATSAVTDDGIAF
jgi:hypothetical protein